MKFKSREARLRFKKLLEAQVDQMNSDHPVAAVAPAVVVVGPLLHTTLQHNSDNHHKQRKGRQHRPRPAVLVVDNFGCDPVGDNKTVVAAAEVVSIGHYMNHHGVALGVDSSVPMAMLAWSYSTKVGYGTYHCLNFLLD